MGMKRAAEGRPRGRWLRAPAVVLLALLALGARLPALQELNFQPDAAEYAGMARRWAQGRGPTTALKWHFLDDGPVVRPAANERPILYPAFGAAVLRAAPSLEPILALQVANALLSAANVLLALAAFSTIVSPAAAWLAAGVLIFVPGMCETATVAISEQLFLFLWLAGLLVLPRVHRPAGAAALGLLAGLAMLTRPVGLFLLPAGALWLWRCRREGGRPPLRDATHAAESQPAGSRTASRRLVWMPWSALAAGFGVALLGGMWLSGPAGGPELRPGMLVNYVVLNIRDATWHGFGRPMPAPLAFLRAHWPAVLHLIREKLNVNLDAVVLSLGALLVPAALAVGAPARATDSGRRALRAAWLTAAGLNFATYTLSWVPVGAMRYMLPTAVVLLPLVVDAALAAAAVSRARKVLLAAAVAAALAPMLASCAQSWRAGRDACPPEGWHYYLMGARWLHSAAGPEDVVASNNPWMVSYLAERPAIVCPEFEPGAGLERLAHTFDVRWVLLYAGQEDARVRHCLRSPAARLLRHARDPGGNEAWLFAVRRDT